MRPRVARSGVPPGSSAAAFTRLNGPALLKANAISRPRGVHAGATGTPIAGTYSSSPVCAIANRGASIDTSVAMTSVRCRPSTTNTTATQIVVIRYVAHAATIGRHWGPEKNGDV